MVARCGRRLGRVRSANGRARSERRLVPKKEEAVTDHNQTRVGSPHGVMRDPSCVRAIPQENHE
jgi:hypothetical protein